MKYGKIWPHVVFVILVGVFVFTQPPPKNNQIISAKETAGVLKVVDGDTIEVSLSGRTERVRLIGIDSPEVLDDRKPIQCFGEEASNKAKEILTGKTITLQSDSTQEERDEYARLLRYIFLDSLNFNELMLSEGYAREYTFKGKIYKYQTEFIQAEKEARKENKGLWGAC